MSITILPRLRFSSFWVNGRFGVTVTKRRRNILIVLGAAVVLLIFLATFIGRERSSRVQLAEVVLGRLVSTVSASGVVRPATEVQISSNIPGTIERLPVSEGDTVKEGELLVQLEQQEYQAALSRAQAALDLAQAALTQSRAQFERAEQLFEQELISRQQFEAAQTQFLTDQARVREAQASVQQARRQLEQTTITSPITGTITDLNAEAGEQVITGSTNIPGTVLMVVSDLSEMQVQAQVSEAEVARINKGQSAVIEVEAFPGRTFEGEVQEVGYSPQQQDPTAQGAVNYSVRVGFQDTVSALKPGMTAYVDIITARADSVLMVPIQAVLTRPVEQLSPDFRPQGAQPGDEVQAVFVYENGVAYLVPVKTGIAGEEFIEIVSGLQRGQEVITGPFEVLRELQAGDRVVGG